jgi:hypothetical protein
LVWIAGCWNILLTSRNLRTIVDFPAFLEHGSAEKIAVCAHTNRDPNKQEVGSFLSEAAQNLEVFSKIQKILN